MRTPLAPPHVAGHNLYERVFCVVPLVGRGTWDDPKRPLYAPLLRSGAAPTFRNTDILAYSYVTSDDGQFALVQFVARDRRAFQSLLGDTIQVLKTFAKESTASATIEAEFQKYRKTFKIDQLTVVVP